MSKKVVDVTISDAASIVDLVGHTLDQIKKTENQLKLVCPILGEAKTEESLQFDIRLAETVSIGVKENGRFVGHLFASHFKSLYPEYVPVKKYTGSTELFYINTLIVGLKETNDDVFYDLSVLNLLFEELKNIAGNHSIVMNLPEDTPNIGRIAQTFHELAKFEGAAVQKDFFGVDKNSWFLEIKPVKESE